DDLLEAGGVAQDGHQGGRDLEVERNARRARQRTKRLPRRAPHLCGAGWHEAEVHLAADDARRVEQILDELRLRLRVALDGVDGACVRRGIVGAALAQL